MGLSKVDSRISACSVKPLRDSRIVELESRLLLKKPAAAAPCTASLVFKPRKEIRLDCLSMKRGEEIRDSSPQAESLEKPTSPPPQKPKHTPKPQPHIKHAII
ncbi:Uncharacterised protein [Helicobacter canis]|uniref:Uncharacterized protein n=1 Tax=Helicobacter canis TaxID=29419 RepID=A0A377J498_9HELI|nr:Uncharacterised protein [Helicobacter canis]